MDHNVKGRVGDDSFVESALLGDVLDDGEAEVGIRVSFGDAVGFLLGTDGCYDGVATLEKGVQDVGCDKTASTWRVVVISGLQSRCWMLEVEEG